MTGVHVGAGAGFVAYLMMVRLDAVNGTLRDRFVDETVVWYLIAFAGFVLALWGNERRPVSLRWLWLIAIVFRLLLLFTTPTLSDDVYRYLWDGHVATEGVNPYTYSLDAPELDRYEIPARALANQPELGTPYLPATQAVFAASALLFPSEPLTMQVVMLAFELLAALALARLLRRVRVPDHRLMIYLWNPLVVVEVAHGAHLDALMAMLAVLAFVYAGRNASPVALALGTLTRPLPALLLPVLWWRWGWRQRGLYAGIVVAALVPFGLTAGWGLGRKSTGTGLFGSIRTFSSEFRFNGGIFDFVEGLFTDATARAVAIAAMLLIVAIVWRQAAQVADELAALRLAFVPLAAFVLLSPVVHPWYLLIVVAFLPFLTPTEDEPKTRWLLAAPWLYLSAAISLSYLTYRDPLQFAELDWVRAVEWLPTLALLALSTTALASLTRTVRK